MMHLPHDGFKWILNVVDHWLKFTFALFPFPQKSVTSDLETWVLTFIGLPSIIQSDNGREFVDNLFEEMLASWPGSVQHVSGQPRYPQSQGLVEQAHYTFLRVNVECYHCRMWIQVTPLDKMAALHCL